MSFNDKAVWITGASSGIGEALAGEFALRGASIILSGRRQAELERVAHELGAKVDTTILPFEATGFERLPEIVERAWNWRGGIDLLVNNAGISQRSLALDTEFEVYIKLMEVDYFAPLRLTQLVLPRMVARRQGHLAVVSSVAGKVGSPLRSGYSGAKHALLGYFDSLRAEIEEAYNIKVSVIIPGSVRTAIAVNALNGDGSERGRSDANIENGMSADQTARTIVEGLAVGQREIVVAEGLERDVLSLRAKDPEKLFALAAKEGARLAVLRDSRQMSGVSGDPTPVKSM